MRRLAWICRVAPMIMGCLLVSSLGRAAEDGLPAKPFLWKIEGKGLEKPSFLFGCDYPPSPEDFKHVEAAFAGCDILATDVPLDPESAQKALPLISRTDGKTLQEALGEELAAEVADEFKRIDPRLELQHFKNSKTWHIVWLLPSLKDRLMQVKTVSAVLAERAAAEGKKIQALGSYEEQVAFFNTLSEEEQRVVMKGQLSKLRKERESEIDERSQRREFYRTGEEGPVLQEADAYLAAMFEGQPELLLRFRKGLIDDSNLLFSKRIAESLEASPSKSQFFTFSVGNVITKQGLRDRLSEAGFQITRINP